MSDAETASPTAPSARPRRGLIPLLLLALTLAVYAPALWNGFVWDDTALVLRDPFIRSWRLIPEGFGHFLFTDATASDFYRPVQRLLFTFDYAVFGFAPRGYHLMSILLHSSAAIALWFLLIEFTGRERRGSWLAGAAAFLWVIHPLHTSAVTYVAGSADLLAALFGFTALKLALRTLRGSAPFLAAGAALCFLLAMLSKESGVMFTVILLLWLALQRKWADLFRWGGVVLLMIGVYLLCRLMAVHEPAPSFTPPPPLRERPLLVLQALGEYARLVAAPLDLHMERALATGSAAWLQAMAGLFVLAGLAAGLAWAHRRRNGAGLLLAAAGLAFLPVSNVFALNAPVAEHWLYAPLAFLLGAAAVSAREWRLSYSRVIFAGLALWSAGLMTRTFVRNFDWRDQRTFVERTIVAGGDSSRMWMTLASLQAREGNLAAARRSAEQALEISPGHPFGLLRLAGIAIVEKRFSEARELLDQLENKPFFAAERLIDLAAIARTEEPSAYLPLLERAAERKPGDWSVQKRYLAALARAERGPEARERLSRILERQPYRAESWLLLATLLNAEGLPDMANRALREAQLRDVRLERSE